MKKGYTVTQSLETRIVPMFLACNLGYTKLHKLYREEIAKLSNYQVYQFEKQKLQSKNLTPAEYQKELKKLCRRLKV